jgi:hypothetical protein
MTRTTMSSLIEDDNEQMEPHTRAATGHGGGVRSPRRRNSRIRVPTRQRASKAIAPGICDGRASSTRR